MLCGCASGVVLCGCVLVSAVWGMLCGCVYGGSVVLMCVWCSVVWMYVCSDFNHSFAIVSQRKRELVTLF